MSETARDAQTDFLAACAADAKVVWVFLVNGIRLTGSIASIRHARRSFAVPHRYPDGLQARDSHSVRAVHTDLQRIRAFEFRGPPGATAPQTASWLTDRFHSHAIAFGSACEATPGVFTAVVTFSTSSDDRRVLLAYQASGRLRPAMQQQGARLQTGLEGNAWAREDRHLVPDDASPARLLLPRVIVDDYQIFRLKRCALPHSSRLIMRAVTKHEAIV
jgi:host factor-I protein